MNLLLVSAAERQRDHHFALTGKRAARAVEIHRLQVGQTVAVGEIGGKQGRAIVTATDRERVELTVELTKDPPPPIPVAALVALARPPTLRRVLHSVATLGVKQLLLVRTERTEKSYLASHLLRDEEIYELLISGLEQACDTVLPRVEIYKDLWSCRTEGLPRLSGFERRFCFCTTAPSEKTIAAVTASKIHSAVVAFGPELGWSDRERLALAQEGFELVTLGPRILRVDTALTFALGQVAAGQSQLGVIS